MTLRAMPSTLADEALLAGQAPGEGDDQSDRPFDIVEGGQLARRVHVAQRQRDEAGPDASTPATTSTCAPPASAAVRAASSALYAPSRLSSARETKQLFGSSNGSPSQTPASPTRRSSVASSRSRAPTSMCRSVCSRR